MKAIAISKMDKYLLELVLLSSVFDPHNYWKSHWNSHMYVGMFITYCFSLLLGIVRLATKADM